MPAERRSRMLKDMGVLGMSQAGAQLLNMAALVIVARLLGAYGFGLQQMGVVVSAYALLVAEMGLMSLGIREISRLDDRARIHAYVRTHLGLLSLLAVAVLALGALVLPLTPFFAKAPWVFVLYLLCVLPQVFMLDWVSTGLQDMKWTGLFWVMRSLVYAGLVLLLLPHADGALGLSALGWVPVFFLAAFVLADLLLGIQIRRLLGGGTLAPRWGPREEWGRRLHESAPIGMTMVVMRILWSIDVLMLGLLRDPETVGLYAAASKLVAVLLIGTTVVWKVLLPRLSRLWAEDPPTFHRVFGRYAGLAVAVLLPVAVGGHLLGPDLMDWIYGDRYEGTGPLFQLLVVAYPLLALGMFFGNGLIASDRQRAYLPQVILAALLMIGLHAVLIPRRGAEGACWAALLGALALMLLTAGRVRASLGRSFWSPVGQAVVAGGGLWVAVTLLDSAPLVLRLFAAIAGYSLAATPLLWGLLRPRSSS